MDLFGAEAVLDDDEVDGFDEPSFASSSLDEGESEPLSPRTNDQCLGHADLEASLLHLFNEGRLPHTLILAGLEGIGKSTFAFRLARFLLSQEESGGLFGDPPPATNLAISRDHTAFRQAASGAHPDFLFIERKLDELRGRKAGTLDVEEVRKIVPFLRLSSTNGGWRVVIVDDADTMGRSSQNAILKILEEPPPKTLIILIAHRAGALIPTIRSRAQIYHLNAPAMADFESILHHAGQGMLSAQEMKSLYDLAEGSPGRALMLLQEGGLEMLGRLIAGFTGYPAYQWSALHALADELARPGADVAFDNFSFGMLWLSQNLVRAKARGGNLPAPLQNPVFLSLLEQASLTELSETLEELQEHLSKTDHSNLEKREAVLRCYAIWARK